ncbi:unnamed protein product, partial [Protopolystoma xenopodis]
MKQTYGCYSNPGWTSISTSHRSYQYPQRVSNRDKAGWKRDTLTTRLHCQITSVSQGINEVQFDANIKLITFLCFINQVDCNIKLTMEMEVNNTLPFFDVLVIRAGEKLSRDVYRKPTHVGFILNFFSNHSYKLKVG